MYRIIVTLTFIIICTSIFANNSNVATKKYIENPPVDSTTYLILQLDFEAFRGKPIDSFLVKLPQNYSITGKLRTRAITPNGLILTYPNGSYIYVYIKHPLSFVSNPHVLPSQWSINEIKMEKAYDITLYNGVDCLKGCQPNKEYN